MGDAFAGVSDETIEYMMQMIDNGHEVLSVADNDLLLALSLTEETIVGALDILAEEVRVKPDEFREGLGEGLTRAAMAMRGLMLAYENRIRA